MASLNDKHYSYISPRAERERRLQRRREREKEPIGTKVMEPRKGRGLPVCEHAVRSGGSRPLHLRPVDTICVKLNKIGL